MASLADMPPEILGQILSLVLEENPVVARIYATISRGWQPYMEMQTFSSLRLDQHRTRQALKVIGAARRRYVRKIHMDVILPEYDTPPQPLRAETAEEQAQNNQALTDAITSLFKMLATWEVQPRIALRVSAYSPTDLALRAPRYSTLCHHWKNSRLDLVPDVFRHAPVVPVVTEFICTSGRSFGDFERILSMRSYFEIAAHFPNLHSLDWCLADKTLGNVSRIQMRQDLAARLASFPRSIRHVQLTCRYGTSYGIQGGPPNLCPDGSILDPLSLAVSNLAQRLESLSFHGVIGREALWPQPESNLNFPRLQKLDICFGNVTPSGEWFHRYDPNKYPHILGANVAPGYSSYYTPKTLIVPELVDSYCLAAACVALHMPNLRRLGLRWPGVYPTEMEYEVFAESSKAILTFSGTPPLDASDEVKDAWRKVTRSRVGDGEAMDVRLIAEANIRPLF